MAAECTTVKAVTEITRPLFIYVCVHRHEAHALCLCTTRSSSFLSHTIFFILCCDNVVLTVWFRHKSLFRVRKRSYFFANQHGWKCTDVSLKLASSFKFWNSRLSLSEDQTYAKTGSTGRWSKVVDHESVDGWRKVKKSRQFYLHSPKSQITSSQWALKCVQWMQSLCPYTLDWIGEKLPKTLFNNAGYSSLCHSGLSLFPSVSQPYYTLSCFKESKPHTQGSKRESRVTECLIHF